MTPSIATYTVPGYVTIVLGDDYDGWPCGGCMVVSLMRGISHSVLLIV